MTRTLMVWGAVLWAAMSVALAQPAGQSSAAAVSSASAKLETAAASLDKLGLGSQAKGLTALAEEFLKRSAANQPPTSQHLAELQSLRAQAAKMADTYAGAGQQEKADAIRAQLAPLDQAADLIKPFVVQAPAAPAAPASPASPAVPAIGDILPAVTVEVKMVAPGAAVRPPGTPAPVGVAGVMSATLRELSLTFAGAASLQAYLQAHAPRFENADIAIAISPEVPWGSAKQVIDAVNNLPLKGPVRLADVTFRQPAPPEPPAEPNPPIPTSPDQPAIPTPPQPPMEEITLPLDQRLPDFFTKAAEGKFRALFVVESAPDALADLHKAVAGQLQRLPANASISFVAVNAAGEVAPIIEWTRADDAGRQRAIDLLRRYKPAQPPSLIRAAATVQALRPTCDCTVIVLDGRAIRGEQGQAKAILDLAASGLRNNLVVLECPPELRDILHVMTAPHGGQFLATTIRELRELVVQPVP